MRWNTHIRQRVFRRQTEQKSKKRRVERKKRVRDLFFLMKCFEELFQEWVQLLCGGAIGFSFFLSLWMHQKTVNKMYYDTSNKVECFCLNLEVQIFPLINHMSVNTMQSFDGDTHARQKENPWLRHSLQFGLLYVYKSSSSFSLKTSLKWYNLFFQCKWSKWRE